MERDWVELKIDEQRMWASLTIKRPIGEEFSYFSSDFIESYIKENGIKAGIIYENIQALSNVVPYGQEMLVAKGKPPVNGRDGFYSFTVATEDSKNKPTVNEDGSVDYYNSLKLAMVKEGDVIAVYQPPTPGEYGYTIFSEMLPPVKGRELRPLRGKGFKMTDDFRYIALFDGRICRQEQRIVIEKVYSVKGDLDIEEGNIQFNGNVEIKGDVRSGLAIEAAGDIFVYGHVGACHLTAGGNITIRKGVQGRDKCIITAGKDVACSFIERCTIYADGNVYADSILDSEIIAKQQVIVSSKRGAIVGGNVTGVQGVVAKNAGNDTGILTVINAGVIQEDLNRLAQLVEEIDKAKSNNELLEKNLKIYEALDGSRRTKETEAVRMKILRAKIMVATEQKKLQEEYDQLEYSIETAKKEAMVHIKGVAYAGIKICIGRNSLVTQESLKDVKYKCVRDEVVLLSGDD